MTSDCVQSCQGLISIATEDTQQHQQVGKDVIDVEINRQGCADVIGLTTVDDTLQINQHER